MSEIFNFFTGTIRSFSSLSAEWVLGSLFLAAALVFFTGLILNIFFKNVKLFNKDFYFCFSNFAALTALVYCLAETYYIGKSFTLISSFLTVGVFYLLSQLKYFIIPIKKNRAPNIKKLIDKTLKPYSNGCFAKQPAAQLCVPVSSENFKSYVEFDNILKKLKANQNAEKENAVPGIKKEINISAVKNFTDKLKDKELTDSDKATIESLDKFSYSLSGKDELSNKEVIELNDSLLSLLKMMSKYNI